MSANVMSAWVKASTASYKYLSKFYILKTQHCWWIHSKVKVLLMQTDTNESPHLWNVIVGLGRPPLSPDKMCKIIPVRFHHFGKYLRSRERLRTILFLVDLWHLPKCVATLELGILLFFPTRENGAMLSVVWLQCIPFSCYDCRYRKWITVKLEYWWF